MKSAIRLTTNKLLYIQIQSVVDVYSYPEEMLPLISLLS